MSKSDVLGQILTVVLSVFYGILSFKLKYYGEVITYLFMTAPIALLSVFTWIKNPFKKKQIKISKLNISKSVIMFNSAIVVTVNHCYVK